MRHEAPRLREAAPHWLGARDRKLLLPYCPACGRYLWPAPAACRGCGGTLEWRECSGKGEIVTYSVVRRAADPALKDDEPYVVAIVALDEGVRMFTNIVDAVPDALRAGLRVHCRFEPTVDAEAWVPVFSPRG